MTEEAKRCVKALRFKEDFECIECPIPAGNCEENCMLDVAADLIEYLSAQLEQVTKERDALLDEVRGECDICANKKDCTAPKCRRSTHNECEECPCRTCIFDTNWKWEGVEATDDAQKGSDAKS